MNSGIIIRMGAAQQSLQAGNTVIDLAAASKEERYNTRRTLIEGLKKQGYFGAGVRRKAERRDRFKARSKVPA